jgi:hypothetical protein
MLFLTNRANDLPLLTLPPNNIRIGGLGLRRHPSLHCTIFRAIIAPGGCINASAAN